MKARVSIFVGVASILALCACTDGTNPLSPSSFSDQFRHLLRFSRVDAANDGGVIQGNEQGFVMLRFKATVKSPSEPVLVESFTFTSAGTGDDSTAVEGVSLYRDMNRDGKVGPEDSLLGTGTFGADDGRVRIPMNQVLDHGETRKYILTYDFNGSAVAGDTFRVRLFDDSDVDSIGEESGCPVTVEGLPVKGAEVVVGDATQPAVVVSLGSKTPAARNVSPQALGVGMVQVLLGNPGSTDVRVDSLAFTASGTGDDAADIAAVRLYRDANSNGKVDASGDVLIGTGAYAADNGTVTFALGTGLTVGRASTAALLLVYDLSGSAWIDETFQAGIESGADLTGSWAGSGAPATFTGTPVDGHPVTIRFGE